MRIITIARKPLSEKTVASNVLKHGCGGLNVDGCRVGKDVDTSRPNNNLTNTMGYGGRWPANLILIHKAGCECVGMKRIKGNRVDTRPEGDGGRADKSQWRFRPTDQTKRGFSEEDGKETVEDWNCEEGCPVGELGEQGGILKSGLLKSKHKGFGNHGIYGKAEVEVYHPTYGDTGSAARFFKQIKDS